MKRITAIVTALLILACTVFSACSCHIQLFPQPTPEPYVTAVPGDTKTDTPEKTEAPTDDPNETEAPGDADETEAPTHDPHIRTADDDAFDEI